MNDNLFGQNRPGLFWQRGMWLNEDGSLDGTAINTRSVAGVDPRADASGLVDGTRMFYGRGTFSSCDVELPNLADGTEMFYGCAGLKRWSIPLPNLKTATSMFANSGLAELNVAEFPNLVNADRMFSGCSLRTLKLNLPKVESLTWFCGNTGLASVEVALPNLKTNNAAFTGCQFTSWNNELPALVDGNAMFYADPQLVSFNVDLPKLSTGGSMFYGCNLDKTSILRILDSIPSYDSGSHPLHLGKRTNYMYSQEVAECFDEKPVVDAEHPLPAGTYHCKGWTITVQS